MTIVINTFYQPASHHAMCIIRSTKSRSKPYISVKIGGDAEEPELEIDIRPDFDPEIKKGIEAFITILDMQTSTVGSLSFETLLQEMFLAGVAFAKEYPTYT